MPKHTKTHSRLKSLYRVKNWSEYDQALVQRGSVTIWLSDDLVQSWHYVGEKQRGGRFDYSEQAILIMQMVNNFFHLPNRATEGLIRSVFAMLEIMLSVPDHTILSRRGKGLKVVLPKKTSGHIDIVMDSSGWKIYAPFASRVARLGSNLRVIIFVRWQKQPYFVSKPFLEMPVGSFDGDSSHTSINPMYRTQPHDPFGHARKLQGHLISPLIGTLRPFLNLCTKAIHIIRNLPFHVQGGRGCYWQWRNPSLIQIESYAS